MSEEEKEPHPMSISKVKEIYDRILAGEGITPHEGKRLIETLFWLSNEHANAMKDAQDVKWLKTALMTMIHHWGLSGRLELSAKSISDCSDKWELTLSVDLRGSINMKIEGYDFTPKLFLPGGRL